MLMDRIIGAFTFKNGVYADVEKDTTFTPTAWLIVAVTALFGRLLLPQVTGTEIENMNVTYTFSPVATVVGTIVDVAAFAAGVFIIVWIATTLFKAQVDFGELARTMGLARVWGVLNLSAVLALVLPTLICILSPALFVGGILSIAASLIALKEALDLEWLQTIITLLIGVVAYLIISSVVWSVLGIGALVGA